MPPSLPSPRQSLAPPLCCHPEKTPDAGFSLAGRKGPEHGPSGCSQGRAPGRDGDMMGYRERGRQGFHQRGCGALFLKDGFGSGRERGHCSFADSEEEEQGQMDAQRERDHGSGKRVGWRALPPRHSEHRGSGAGGAEAKVKLPSSSCDGGKEQTGARHGKMEGFSTSYREGGTFPS